MEETLTNFVAEVETISKSQKLKDFAEKLESLSTEMKSEIIEALNYTNQPKKATKKQMEGIVLEESKSSLEEGKEEEYSSDESNIKEDDYMTANEEEISKNRNSSSLSEEADYRVCLPAKRSNLAKVSVWQVLKDLVGKDLTHFAVPSKF